MSGTVIEERVGKVEDELGRHGRELARQGERIGHIETAVSKIGSGVEKLLERDACRPEPWSLTKILGTGLTTLAVTAALWGAVGWLVEHSPAMKGIADRVTDLDHDRRGRVTAVESRVDKLEAWSPTITRTGGRP